MGIPADELHVYDFERVEDDRRLHGKRWIVRMSDTCSLRYRFDTDIPPEGEGDRWVSLGSALLLTQDIFKSNKFEKSIRPSLILRTTKY